jgi:bacterial leucyl aminopeptidase
MMRRTWWAGLASLVVVSVGCGVGTQTDTDSPIVTILAPANGATVTATVVFSAQVLDGFGVAKVRFMVDGQVIDSTTTEPYQTTWNTRGAGNGPHALRVEGEDTSGNTGFSSIGVTVDNTPN